MAVFVGILAIILLLMLFFLLYSAMKDGWYFFMHSLGLQRFFTRNAHIERFAGYLKDFSYYSALSESGKKIFMDRLLTFKLNKEFTGAGGIVVTEEMKVLISASAIQLTYGLSKYKLETLENIIVFPDTFYLHKRSPEYKGATKGHRMYLSWKAFEEGYAIKEDNLNLGLHEMTHALKLHLKVAGGYDTLFAGRMEYWEEMVSGRFRNNREPTFLRAYSKASPDEFFAVCVEAFFESPSKFQRELPEIFHLLVFLLNQDPLNKLNDYKVSAEYFNNNQYNIPLPEEVKRSYRYSTSHWWMYLMVAGCLGALPTFFFLMGWIMLPYWGYLLILFVLGSIGYMQKRFFEERNILSGRYFLFYAYGGFGGTLFTLLLWINYLLPVSKVHSEEFVIEGYHAEYSYSRRGGKKFIGWRVDVDNEIQLNNQVLTFRSRPEHDEKYLVLNYRYGIFGIKKVESYYYTNDIIE